MLALAWEILVKMEEHALKEWLLASSYAGAEKDTMGKPVKVSERLSISSRMNGSIPFERTVEQITETMALAFQK